MYLKLLALLVMCFTYNGLSSRVPYMSQPHSMQDKYVNENIFRDKRNGVFIDIGAHDGISFSNSYFFEKELGWTGICFEPLAGPFAKLQKNRSCICINACVTHREGKVKFLEVDDRNSVPQYPAYSQNMMSGMLHHYNRQHFERLKTELALMGGSYKIVEMNARKLDNVLQEHNIKKIDYLSVDTEGSEYIILKTIDFKKVPIHVITVENNYNNPKIRTFLESQGFTFLTNLSVDEVYINHNYPLDETEAVEKN